MEWERLVPEYEDNCHLISISVSEHPKKNTDTIFFHSNLLLTIRFLRLDCAKLSLIIGLHGDCFANLV